MAAFKYLIQYSKSIFEIHKGYTRRTRCKAFGVLAETRGIFKSCKINDTNSITFTIFAKQTSDEGSKSKNSN
jgi:hypothetical protein